MSPDKLFPVLHRILVKPDPVEIKTESGIIVQLDKREQKAGIIGTVVKIGHTCFKDYGSTAEELGLHVGSKVYYAKYGGVLITLDGEEYRLLNDEDIIAVYKEE